ncbi:MAG: preprotein translocase subunit SecE [Gammaproteobacteria bacterium]|nr:preprotein translocase subunit SecE [Gammaproteobacteria bacterium]
MKAMLDKVKLAAALVLALAGMVSFYYFDPQLAQLYRVLILLAAMGAAIGITVTTAMGAQLVSFARSASIEMRKSVWPSRRETTQTTLIVLVMVSVVGVMIFIIDSILRWAVKALI